MGPIFNEKVVEKWNLWIHEQCTMCTDWLKKVRKVKLCGYCSCTVQWTVATKFDFSIFFSQLVHIVHCSWTHKFHFSVTFSLKMGPTVLFTHLKIILLQYFSVFSFSFQFSAVSKRTLSLLPFLPLIPKCLPLPGFACYGVHHSPKSQSF